MSSAYKDHADVVLPYSTNVPDNMVMLLGDDPERTYSVAINGGFHFDFYKGSRLNNPLPVRYSYEPPTLSQLYHLSHLEGGEEEASYETISSAPVETESLSADFDYKRMLSDEDDDKLSSSSGSPVPVSTSECAEQQEQEP